MRLTFDSDEPLDDVLRVLGAMYSVTLTLDGAAPAALDATTSRGAQSPGRGRRAATGRRAAARSASAGERRGRARGQQVSNAEVRDWARRNGQPINDRGRIPAAVIAAYRAAND